MKGRYMNGDWEGCGRKLSLPNVMYYPGIFLEGLKKTTKPQPG
jgi:hypothetical protein